MTTRARSEQTEQPEAPEPVAEKQFVEYLGEDKYGTEFIDVRLISRKDAKDGWDISIPKDLRWTKDAQGRMRLPVSDIPADALERILAGKTFKLVTEA